LNNLGIQAAPLPLCLPLDYPIDRIGDVLDGDVHRTILEPFDLPAQAQAGPSQIEMEDEFRAPIPGR
jgi:hypothetical protein